MEFVCSAPFMTDYITLDFRESGLFNEIACGSTAAAPPLPPLSGPIKGKETLRPQRQEQRQMEESKRGLSKRDQELRDRKAYLKNFWYAAGKP
jgi:hypothetical protein